MEKKHTNKKHTKQESEHEELMGEAPSIIVPDVSEHTDEEGINNDTAMPVHHSRTRLSIRLQCSRWV